MIQFQDQTLKCKDCPDEFLFSAGEQAFYAEKQLTNPVRCRACRAANKARREQPQTTPALMPSGPSVSMRGGPAANVANLESDRPPGAGAKPGRRKHQPEPEFRRGRGFGGYED